MTAMLRPFLFVLLPFGAVADAGKPAGQDPPAVEVQDPPAPGEDAALLTLTEVNQRLTVPVALGTSRTYPFVIDTGAERTVISRELAGALQFAAGAPVNLTSMTERSVVNTVIVPELMIQSIGERHRIVAPALLERNLGASGLLGIDTLRNHQVAIDFDTGQMTVRPSERRRRSRSRDRDEIVVTARSRFGQLIVTDAYYGDIRVQVVLDTGSQISMGNSALRRVVGRRVRDMQQVTLTSVTGGQTTADYTTVPNIRIGNVRFGALPVAFSDVAPFERFGLTRRPALLLGMDALRSFRHVEIDFPNRQVRFRMPRGAFVERPGPPSVVLDR